MYTLTGFRILQQLLFLFRQPGLLKDSDEFKNDTKPQEQKGENMELVDNSIYEATAQESERTTEQLPINNGNQVSYDVNVYESVT